MMAAEGLATRHGQLLRVAHPGDGEWIMAQCGGRFDPEQDRVFATHRLDALGDHLLGGFALTDYNGASLQVHMAGSGRWCSRTLLWMMFHYAFIQAGCRKLIAPVPSDNLKALELDLRAGWRIETKLTNVLPDGRDLWLLTMLPGDCRWLRVKPHGWAPGEEQHHG